LAVWKRAVESSADIYKRARDLKDFGFRDQVYRAKLPIPSNIVAGLERGSTPDQIKLLDYARATCGQVRAQTIISRKVGFIHKAAADERIQETRELSAMIQGLILSIR
jgi:four helix bundle protein